MVVAQGFKVEIATRYGIKEAIVFEIIKTCICLNHHNPTCLPLYAIRNRAPYISKGTLKRVISNLENANLISKRKGYDDLLGLGNIYELTEYGEKFA